MLFPPSLDTDRPAPAEEAIPDADADAEMLQTTFKTPMRLRWIETTHGTLVYRRCLVTRPRPHARTLRGPSRKGFVHSHKKSGSRPEEGRVHPSSNPWLTYNAYT